MPCAHTHVPLRRTRVALACAGLLAVAAPASIAATADPATRAQQPAPQPVTGGMALPGAPAVRAASCARQQAWTCARGQVLTLSGDSLQGVRAIVFEGARQKRDDLRIKVGARAAQSGQLLIVVPRRARSGPLRIVSALGHVARTPQPLSVVAELPGTDDASGLRQILAGGKRPAVFGYTAAGGASGTSRVEAVRVADGAVVRSWPLEPDAAGAGEVRWDGFVGDKPARSGTYLMRLSDGPAQAQAAADADYEFELLSGLFPIRGRHALARSPMQRFGGPRGHQGTDNFASCDTPLAAYTKGVVQFTGTHAAAGNYVVVEQPDGISYAYMHMRAAALVQVGDRVFAGQRLGNVGSTGRASECHLHFELWSAPGWQRGGAPRDPGPLLRRLDAHA